MNKSIKDTIQKMIVALVFMVGILNIGSAFAIAQSSSNPTNNPVAEYTLLEPLPCIPSETVKCTPGIQKNAVNFQDYVQYAFNLFIAIAAVSAVFMIVWGGFLYMTSEAPGGKSDGLKKVENAIYGLLLVLCSFLILRTIDPRLVQIPTTLVAPLDITYRPDEIATFMKSLNDEANRLRNVNIGILNNLEKARAEHARLDSEKKQLCDQLASDLGFGQEPTGSSCDDLVRQSIAMSPETKALAARIQGISGQQRTLETQMTTNTTIGSMNAVIQKCMSVSSENTRYWLVFNAESGGFSQQDCDVQMNRAAALGISTLKAMGDNVAAKELEEYKIYASSISKINSAVKINMAKSPDVTAAVDTLQTAVTTAATAAGSVYGGPVIGVAAFAGAQIFNGLAIGASVQADDKKNAELTIAQIQREINNTANTITNPKIKGQYTTQAYALIKTLGGKGDGTDSIQPAIDKDRLNNLTNTNDGQGFVPLGGGGAN